MADGQEAKCRLRELLLGAAVGGCFHCPSDLHIHGPVILGDNNMILLIAAEIKEDDKGDLS